MKSAASILKVTYAIHYQAEAYILIHYQILFPFSLVGYVESLIERETLKCYYRPGNEDHVYVETGDWDSILTEFIILLILTIIGGLFILGVLIFVISCLLYSALHKVCSRMCHSCNKLNTKICNYMCFHCFTQDQRKSRFVKALEMGDLKSVKTLARDQQKLINSVVEYRNCQTHPLIIASAKGHVNIVEYLLLKGAKISVYEKSKISCDILHYKTALHYASEIQNVELIHLLIRHGCMGYLSLPKTGDCVPVTLLKNKDMESLKLLIHAGYPLHKDTEDIITKMESIVDTEIRSFIFQELENPPSLQRTCLRTIRETLGHCRIQAKLNALSLTLGGPLPEVIVKYLKLEVL